MISLKYNRTLHLPWSPGGTKYDRMAKSVTNLLNRKIIITEKMDGSNVSLEVENCFARTHASAPNHPSFDALKALHASAKYGIPGGMQIFGEWCYALHSIAYSGLSSYFLAFAARDIHTMNWKNWDYVQNIANDIGVTTVPILWEGIIKSQLDLRNLTELLAKQPSACGGVREGVVVRVYDSFEDSKFSDNVMKFVRKNHVQTTDHWKNQEIVKNKLLA